MNTIAKANGAIEHVENEKLTNRVDKVLDSLGPNVIGWVQEDIPLLFIEQHASPACTMAEFVS
jgi:hypothetical protein